MKYGRPRSGPAVFCAASFQPRLISMAAGEAVVIRAVLRMGRLRIAWGHFLRIVSSISIIHGFLALRCAGIGGAVHRATGLHLHARASAIRRTTRLRGIIRAVGFSLRRLFFAGRGQRIQLAVHRAAGVRMMVLAEQGTAGRSGVGGAVRLGQGLVETPVLYAFFISALRAVIAVRISGAVSRNVSAGRMPRVRLAVLGTAGIRMMVFAE